MRGQRRPPRPQGHRHPLTTDFHDTDDPKERRRIAGPLLRASTPIRLPAPMRARAGAAPVSAAPARAAGAPADPGPPIALPPECPPGLDELPEHARHLYSKARHAGEAFNANPTEANRAEYTRAAKAFNATQGHHGPAPAPPVAPTAPCPSPPPLPIPSPAPTLRALLSRLHHWHQDHCGADQAFLDAITGDFTFDRLSLPKDQKRILTRAKIEFASATIDPKSLPALDAPHPAPSCHGAPALPPSVSRPNRVTAALTLRLRRGDHTTPFTFTFLWHTERWLLSRIQNNRPPPR